MIPPSGPDFRTFARSAIKPLQALPLVADGAAEHFGLTPSEVAIACGSHSGEDVHVDAVRSIRRKIDLDEAALHGGEALRQLEVLGADDLPALEAHYRPAVLHRRGLQVGEIRATFTLQ